MAQNFNAAVGGSESAINDVLAQIFATLRPTGIFHFKPDINLDGVSSADVDIVDAPRLSLKVGSRRQMWWHDDELTIIPELGSEADRARNLQVHERPTGCRHLGNQR